MMTATTTEVQNNFGKYLQKVQEGEEERMSRHEAAD